MPIAIPTLDDKLFADLIAEARLLIPRHAPSWTDHNVHDPGITLIELLAWLAEAQIYTLDQVTDRHLHKFLRLLGRPPKPAHPATALVTFTLPESRATPLLIPQGTGVRGRPIGAASDIPFETSRDLWVAPASFTLVKIERLTSRGRVDLTPDRQRGLYLYGLGGELGEMVEVGSSLRLGFRDRFPAPEITLGLELYEADLPPPGTHGDEPPDVTPSAEVTWEYYAEDDRWHALTALVDHTQALSVSGILSFVVPQSPPPRRSESLYWIRGRVTRAGYEIPPRIAAFYLNAVPVTQQRSVPTRPLGAGSGLPSQQIELHEAPIVADSLALEVLERDGEWHLWTQVVDFDASQPEDRHFVLDLATGVLAFGDGFHGRFLPGGTNNVRASYRVGGGDQGNLAVGEINRLEMVGSEGVTLTNPEAATGGRAAESIAAAWVQVKADLATPYRAVTSDDFEMLAKATPGLRVARAQAIPGYDPEQPASSSHCLVSVVVVPYSLTDCPTPSAGFLQTVCRHLDRHRLITTDLHVIPPLYVKISIAAEVTVQPKSAPEVVRRQIEERLAAFVHPLHGGTLKTGWPFGRSVYRSELANVIERVEGVECLVRLSITGDGGTLIGGDLVGLPQTALICAGQFDIDIRQPQPVCEVK